MFTDRFIEFSVTLYEKKDAEMIGYNKNTATGVVRFKVNPFEISHYRETFDEEENIATLLYFKCGDSVEISMTLDEFEKILNKVQ